MRLRKTLKITVLLGMDIVFVYLIISIWIMLLLGSPICWRNLKYELVTKFDYNYLEKNEYAGIAPPAVYDCVPALREGEKGFWFYEIRNDDEWEYFCDMLGIEKNYELDFSDYYVISINRELEGLHYNNFYWNTDKYGSLVRADFNLDSSSEQIYLYRLNKKISFYYNDRDYELGKYNMNYKNLFIFNAEPYEPYLLGPLQSE